MMGTSRRIAYRGTSCDGAHTSPSGALESRQKETVGSTRIVALRLVARVHKTKPAGRGFQLVKSGPPNLHSHPQSAASS